MRLKAHFLFGDMIIRGSGATSLVLPETLFLMVRLEVK